MFEHVLVAVDGSSTSNRALAAALTLAREEKATLHALHVVDQTTVALSLAGGYYVPPDYVDSLLAALREQGRRILSTVEAAARRKGQVVQTALVENFAGTVADAILRHARKVHAEVIVVGTHGRRGVPRLLMGSNAEAVLRQATVPVLLVRADARLARAPTATPTKRVARRRSRVEIVRPSPPYP